MQKVKGNAKDNGEDNGKDEDRETLPTEIQIKAPHFLLSFLSISPP